MGHERSTVYELLPEVTQAFSSTFIPRFDMYPIQLASGRYISVHKRLDMSLVEAHLKGRVTLGAYALSPDSTATWVCFDADSDEQWNKLRELARGLDLQSVPAYLETSRRGGHLWLFTSPLSGTNVRRFGRQLIEDNAISEVEIFPKQDVLVTGPGSLVRLPFGKHLVTGREYHFVNPDRNPIAPSIREQLSLLASPQRVPPEFIAETLARAPEPTTLVPTPSFQLKGKAEGQQLSERLKNSVTVYDFVRQYVELDPRGRGYCPFHDDQHRSFSVHIDRNFWNCFAGCGGGSIIDFYMKWREQTGEDPDFVPTVTALADLLL